MDKGQKISLKVLGFSFNQAQSGAYGLVLAEENGNRRLMVVVGSPEAQSIAFKLQNAMPPRPLTHDLFKPIFDSFFINLQEVIISDYVDGVFHSKLVLRQDDHIIEIDSRTSDAVAIAIRLDAPIYTYESIMQELGVVIDESALEEVTEGGTESGGKSGDYSLLDIEQLQERLKNAIEEENYELASVLRDEIQKKKGTN